MAQSAQPIHGGGETVAIRAAEADKAHVAASNSHRVATSMSGLATISKLGNFDPREFCNHAITLSKGIDYAIAYDEKPSAAQNLPALVKQICDPRFGPELDAFIMILLISIKNACKVGWFAPKETEETLTLINELAKNFGTPVESYPVASSLSTVETVMERFYPQLKIEEILCTFEVKTGYGVYANDFLIMKKSERQQEKKIRLLVAQVDNMDTSACIITPQQVSLMINGRAVDWRTTVAMETNPQMPTNVTPYLKYGTNLFQAFGQFNGNYVILIAFMSETPINGNPVLQDHVQPLVDGSDSDPELIEGPSRISLNCPISRSRIKLPAKGHSCKHLQCFDFTNFIDINTRKPYWRCPHCNQSVCYTDIRVDQNIAKVLKEVGGDITDVIISADGSWKAVLENDDRSDRAHETNHNSLQETSGTIDQNALSGTIDLTRNDCAMEVDNARGIEDIKPSIADLRAAPQPNSTAGAIQTTPIEDLYAGSGFPSEALMSNISYLNNYQLQPTPFMNSIPSNEYGMSPSISRTVTRTPIAVQALPAQPEIPRFRPGLNTASPVTPNCPHAGPSPTVNGYNAIYGDFERLCQPQAPVTASQPPLFTTQNRVIPPREAFRSLSEFQNSHLNQALNPSLSQPMMAHSHSLSRAGPPGYPSTARRPPHMGGSVPTQTQSPDLAPELSWRPAGRMRGSLSGHDIAKLRDILIQPTQSPRPPPAGPLSPPLQAHLANRLARSSEPRNDATR